VESEHNEVDGMKKGVDSKGEVMPRCRIILPLCWLVLITTDGQIKVMQNKYEKSTEFTFYSNSLFSTSSIDFLKLSTFFVSQYLLP